VFALTPMMALRAELAGATTTPPSDSAATIRRMRNSVKVLQEKLRTYRSKRLNATGYCLEVADDNGNHLFDVPVGLPIIQQERDATRT
jgi:hypothetical protein